MFEINDFLFIQFNGFKIYVIELQQVFGERAATRANFQQLPEVMFLQRGYNIAANLLIFQEMLTQRFL